MMRGEMVAFGVFYILAVFVPCFLTITLRNHTLWRIVIWTVFTIESVLFEFGFGTVWLFAGWVALYLVAFRTQLPLRCASAPR